MSNIRVTYSGLIGLLVGLSTVITGMIFILIITRSLSPEELGTWSLIGGLITYVIILEPIISYWTTREIARDIDSGKTAILSSSAFSIVGVLAFILIAYVVSEPTGTSTDILFFAALMIPLSFLNRTLSAIALGSKPQVNSYGVIIFDIAKIPAALIFVYFMELGIYGAILSLVIAYIPSIIILVILLRNKLQNNFNKDFVKNWLKRAWLPSYIKFPLMVVLDVLIFSLITGSVIGLSYWVAAFTIGTAVRHSSQITRAVYPKLLGGGRKEILQENLIKLFYFSFLFISISFAFAKPALFLLNPVYDVAVLVVIFISLYSFVKIIGNAFYIALQGIEKVDTKQSTQKDYLKSKLFFLPSIKLIRRVVYLSILSIGLILLMNLEASNIDLVIYWSIILFIVEIPFTVYFYYLVRKSFPLSLNILIVMKYLVISISVFGGVYLLMMEFLEYDTSIFTFLPNLIPFLLLGVSLYFGLTYIADKKTRKLFNAVYLEIKRKK
jgi:O-antigen/teichoic acid export membrane protein